MKTCRFTGSRGRIVPPSLRPGRPSACETLALPTGYKHKKGILFQGCLAAVWTGLEPATPCVTGRYSNQLNYHTVADCGCKYSDILRNCKLPRNNFATFFPTCPALPLASAIALLCSSPAAFGATLPVRFQACPCPPAATVTPPFAHTVGRGRSCRKPAAPLAGQLRLRSNMPTSGKAPPPSPRQSVLPPPFADTAGGPPPNTAGTSGHDRQGLPVGLQNTCLAGRIQTQKRHP